MNDCRDFDLLVAKAFSLGLHFLHVPVSLLLVMLVGVGYLAMGLSITFRSRPPYSANGVRMGKMIGWGLG